MPSTGTPERPLSVAVAVVGSGPSVFYAAESLLKTPGLPAEDGLSRTIGYFRTVL